MPLQPGTKLGPYEIQSPLGAGGMGEVYKATDTRLDRTVAIKVLPEHVAANPDLKQRFEREARTVAALNHPHICTLHDIGQQDGTDFLVMEYLEGETLAQRLTKGALPLDQALRYAIEIADALDKAHRKGITHRDLKPGNIMVTKAGTKLLDFGLAKLRDPKAMALSLSQRPTQTASLTGEGTILGTLQYMAPEQLEGKDADARTDIFAFGATVYEMVTGKKAFEGKSQASLIGAILKDDPRPITALQPMSPPALDRVIKKCLAKDSDTRWQTAQDLHDELQWIAEAGSEVGVPTSTRAAPQPAAWRRALPLALGASLVVGVLASLAVWSLTRPEPVVPRLASRFALAVPAADQLVNNGGIALSLDGRDLVYVARRDGVPQLFHRAMGELEAVPIRGTEEGARPFFSPDGQWVGFFASGELKKIRLDGGLAITLCPVPGGGFGASWSADGTIVFASTTAPGVMRVSAEGGSPEPVTTVNAGAGEGYHDDPVWLPASQAVLFHRMTGGNQAENAEILVQSLATGERRVLTAGFKPQYTPTGHLVFARTGGLWAAPFDATQLALTGEPRPVVEGVWTNLAGYASYAVADNGSLAYIYRAGVVARTLVWVDRQGREEPIAAPLQDYLAPRISPDGSRVALDGGGRGIASRRIWIWDLVQETLTQLIVGDGGAAYPVWTPDGERVGYVRSPNFYWKASNNTGTPELLAEAPAGEGSTNPSPYFFTPDGTALVFRDRLNPETGDDLHMISLEEQADPVWTLTGDFHERSAELSSDGRWMAYQSDESGEYQIYVRPFPQVEDDQVQVSNTGGFSPLWSRDGRELFYLQPGRPPQLISVSLETGETDRAFAFGDREAIFDWPYLEGFGDSPEGRTYDVSPDGQRFLVVKDAAVDATQAEINVVLNWDEELKARVPTTP